MGANSVSRKTTQSTGSILQPGDLSYSLQLHSLVVNLARAPRRETLHGREYLVFPVTMIVPGVLPGSNGPLFYPASEVGANIEAWNGMPVVVGHPKNEKSENVSARSPGVLERYGVGNIWNTSFLAGKGTGGPDRPNQRLVSEAWIDPSRLQKINSRLLHQLEAGDPTEVSTGLYTTNIEIQGEYNGKPYQYVAMDYKPDHLALLAEEKGACPVEEGCGIHVEQDALPVLPVMDSRKYMNLSRNASSSGHLDLSPEKACKILKDGEANGKPLTEKQKGLFGAKCGDRTSNVAKNGQTHNCGGEGGKPGPCPTGREDAPSSGAPRGRAPKPAPPPTAFPKMSSDKGSLLGRIEGHDDDKKALDSIATRMRQSKDGAEVEKLRSQWQSVYQALVKKAKKRTSNGYDALHGNAGNPNMTRNQAVSWLTTNCDCWKGKQKLLSDNTAFSDNDIRNLLLTAHNGRVNAAVVNALKSDLGITVNSADELLAKIKDAGQGIKRVTANAGQGEDRGSNQDRFRGKGKIDPDPDYTENSDPDDDGVDEDDDVEGGNGREGDSLPDHADKSRKPVAAPGAPGSAPTDKDKLMNLAGTYNEEFLKNAHVLSRTLNRMLAASGNRGGGRPVGNSNGRRQPVNNSDDEGGASEIINLLPPKWRRTLERSARVEDATRRMYIDQLTANAADYGAKERAERALNKLSFEELEALAEAQFAASGITANGSGFSRGNVPGYVGANGGSFGGPGPTVNSSESDDVLLPAQFNE